MKVLSLKQISDIRDHITKKFLSHGEFQITGEQLIPSTISKEKQEIRCHMFMFLKQNQNTMSLVHHDLIKFYFGHGINRFVNTLERRKMLSIKCLKENKTPTQGFILACDNHNADVFDSKRIPQYILDEWNDMMSIIKFHGKSHGIKVIEDIEYDRKGNPSGSIKYVWVHR